MPRITSTHRVTRGNLYAKILNEKNSKHYWKWNSLLGQSRLFKVAKGQLISKCPFGFIVWTKLPTKLFLNFCPEIFCTFLGASWKLFGASCKLPCLWYYIPSPQEAQRASMKPPRKLQKNSGQKSRNNFVGIFVQTMKPKGHFEINWPLVNRVPGSNCSHWEYGNDLEICVRRRASN